MNRKILHLDLDAFFCAVEELENASLRGKPFAVGGRPESRGVVSSCSYAARALGIHSAMPMVRALRLCPGLIIVPPRHRLYSEISEQVMQRLRRLTSLVEQISIDEAFLDISELSEPGEEIARQLQATIRDELGLPCSIGVATNKLVAKTATDFGKAHAEGGGPPNAITVVPAGEEAAFLQPLPVQALWGVGPKSAERLKSIGVLTIGNLLHVPEAELVVMFGKNGHDLVQRAQGIDDRPIITEHQVKSISQETTFARDVRDEKVLQSTIIQLSDNVGRQLRDSSLVSSTIKLKIRWPDFSTLSRQITLEHPTDKDSEIEFLALKLFYKVWKTGKAVRLIGVGAGGLQASVHQLSFWDELKQSSGH